MSPSSRSSWTLRYVPAASEPMLWPRRKTGTPGNTERAHSVTIFMSSTRAICPPEYMYPRSEGCFTLIPWPRWSFATQAIPWSERYSIRGRKRSLYPLMPCASWRTATGSVSGAQTSTLISTPSYPERKRNVLFITHQISLQKTNYGPYMISDYNIK